MCDVCCHRGDSIHVLYSLLLCVTCVAATLPGRELTSFFSVLQSLLAGKHVAPSATREVKGAPQASSESHHTSRGHLTAFYDLKYGYVGLGKRKTDYQNLDAGLSKRRVDYHNLDVGLGKRKKDYPNLDVGLSKRRMD